MVMVALVTSMFGYIEVISSSFSDIRPRSVAVTHDVIGDNIWLTAFTFLDKSLLKLSNGWLWAGMYYILVVKYGL